MKQPGDMIVFDENEVGTIYSSAKIPWRANTGMVGPAFQIPKGTTGIILKKQTVKPENLLHHLDDEATFLYILFPQGPGWIFEGWVKVIYGEYN